MDSIRVTGGKALNGKILITGAKNATLALMPASLLCDQPLTLTNVPRLSDIVTMARLLQSLGVKIDSQSDGKTQVLSCQNINNHTAHYDIVRKMRASILVLGPLLARHGRAQVSLPGGCAIGARPVDIHLSGLAALGATLELKEGYINAQVNNRLHGAQYTLPFASVGATENLLMAATLARGTTILKNVAREPEIIDLAKLLCAMGAIIEGAGSDTIIIEGVERLEGTTHAVIADRIELGTYMLAPAIAGGRVELIGGRRALLETFCQKLEAAGVTIDETPEGLCVKAQEGGRSHAVDITTAPYPGFPTDLQAQMMALMCTADGVATLHETVFENRFMHAPELNRMGANISISGNHATVRGVERLKGAPVMATDLRASVSLLLAALAAKGETTVTRVYHLDRGYEQLEKKLRAVGAEIERIST